MKFCTLASGSSGNCHYVATEKGGLLVDAGLSGKTIQGYMAGIQEDMTHVNAILITHEHSDHIKGAGILSRRFNLPIYANEGTWEAMAKDLGKIATTNIKCFKTGSEMQLNDIVIKSYEVCHDAKEPVGYTFSYGGKKISILTDTGIYTALMRREIEDSDLMVLEANHDSNMLAVGPYPYYLKKRIQGEQGHLSNDDCARLICEMTSEKRQLILLGHLSRENNFPELAYQTVMNRICERNDTLKERIKVGLTYRERPTTLYHL